MTDTTETWPPKKPEGPRHVISVSLPAKLDRKIRAKAKKLKVSVSQFIRDAIEATL